MPPRIGSARLVTRLHRRIWSMTANIAHAAGLHFSPQRVFRHIYRNRTWGDGESVSGPGSELRETEHIRAAIPALLDDLVPGA